MKADDARSPTPIKHQFDHTLPTVIHHPEEDMPALARWIRHAMENQVRFWGMISALVLVVVVLSVIGNGLTLGRAASNEAWAKLETAKTPGERVEIAKDFPKTPAERWALLQAATEYYNQGFNDLPSNREAALPTLKKALDLFEKVAAEAPRDQPQARVAALGLARTLEARNDLDKAAKQYEKVAKTWPGTEEARTAEKLVKTLKSPEAIAFYKELYTFKSPEATLPAGGVGNFKFPFPIDHPPIGGTTANSIPFPITKGMTTIEPSPLAVPPPPPAPAPATSPTTKDEAGLPSDVFSPPNKDEKPGAPK
jgi:hypothetical protein